MAYINSVNCVTGSQKLNTEDKLELRGDLVEVVGEKSFKEAADFLNKQILANGWVIKVTNNMYKSVSQTGRLIKQKLKGKNSKQRYQIREKWLSFGLTEKAVRLETPSPKVNYIITFLAKFRLDYRHERIRINLIERFDFLFWDVLIKQKNKLYSVSGTNTI